jgi:hypothetical protein
VYQFYTYFNIRHIPVLSDYPVQPGYQYV